LIRETLWKHSHGKRRELSQARTLRRELEHISDAMTPFPKEVGMWIGCVDYKSVADKVRFEKGAGIQRAEFRDLDNQQQW
jgi:hypothetical protein